MTNLDPSGTAATVPATQRSQPISPVRPRNASEARAMLHDRLKESEALKLVAMMLATYPGAADPPSYVKSLAGRLMVEPRAVAIACCDPAHGLVREIFVRPTVADIARWCDREAEDLGRMVRADDERRELADQTRERRNTESRDVDRSNRESVDEMRARLGPTFGLKPVPRGGQYRRDDDTDDEEAKSRQAEANARAIDASKSMIAADYARLGVKPISTGGEWNLPVSPTLAVLL